VTASDTTAARVRSGANATTAPSSSARLHPARRARSACERGTRERDVGRASRERVGDDSRLDAAGERRAVVCVVTQLEPARVAHGLGEVLRARRVVEIRDVARTQLPRELTAVRRSSACSDVSRTSTEGETSPKSPRKGMQPAAMRRGAREPVRVAWCLPD
jgi:hypothetical protein